MRKIKYPKDYNPILEYWEIIKHKPLFQKVENLRKDINLLSKEKLKNESIIEIKEKELGQAIIELDKVKSLGAINTSFKVYRVYKHLVKDIMENSESSYKFDSHKSNHAIEFIENYTKHSKGQVGGKPFIMMTWQKALVGAIFGIVHKETELRVIRECFLCVSRKNGKSTLASAIGLYMQVADGEKGAEVYACATKKDQAKIIWEEARRMVKASPILSKKIKCLVAELKAEFNNSFFKFLGRDSNSLDGLNGNNFLLDEIHAWTDKNLYDVLVDSTSARLQSLILITTTAGTVRENVYDMKYDECRRVIDGYDDPNGYKDDTLFPVIYELDNREEWTDTEAYIKASPGLFVIKKFDNLQSKVDKARANPMLVKNLLTKDFNVPETTGEAFFTYEQLNNEAKFNTKELKPKYGIGGIDLSMSTDLCAATLIFRVPDREEIFVEQMYWLPEDLLEKRSKEDKIPYDIWHNLGLLRTTPSNRIDYHAITEWFLEMQDKYDIWVFKIGYDAWSAGYLVQELKDKFGEESVEAVHQGCKTLSSPMRNLGALMDKKLINYNNNPILKWCMSNVAVKEDVNGNIQPMKTSNSRRRIDGFASLLDAYVEYERVQEEYMTLI